VRDFEIILGLLFVAAIVQPAARRLDIPVAIAQVVCGLLLSAVPIVRGERLPVGVIACPSALFERNGADHHRPAPVPSLKLG
jgi:Kef-type K+ transport system membrane component KefB